MKKFESLPYRKVIYFVFLTYFFSWILIPLYFIFGGERASMLFLIVMIIYMFIPMSVALILQKGFYKGSIKESLGIIFSWNYWYLVGWFLPVFLIFTSIGIGLIFPSISWNEGLTFYQIAIGVGVALVIGVTINAIVCFGEELGWRGFLLKELSHLNFFPAAILIGIIWGVWHAPLVFLGHNFPQHNVIGIFMMIVNTIFLSFIFNYIRLQSKSVIPVTICHGTINAMGGIALVALINGNDLTIGMTGVSGLITLFLFTIIVVIFDRYFAKNPVIFKKSWEKL